MDITSFNEREGLIIDFMFELFKTDLPVVLKGNISTRLYCILNNSTHFRETKDIVLNFLSRVKDTGIAVRELNNVIHKINPGYNFRLFREFVESETTAGLELLDENGSILFTIDLDFKGTNTMNFIVIDNINIKTVSAYETFCDKLSVVSTKQGLGLRFKDFIDLYIFLTIMDFDYNFLKSYLDDFNIPLGDFHTLYNEYDLYEHTFSKFSGIIGNFNLRDMMNVVRKFCLPFTSIPFKYEGVWYHEGLKWVEENIPLNPIEQLKQMNAKNIK